MIEKELCSVITNFFNDDDMLLLYSVLSCNKVDFYDREFFLYECVDLFIDKCGTDIYKLLKEVEKMKSLLGIC